LVALGFYVWPSITVKPDSVTFGGWGEEKYDFSVSNQTDEDQYHVAVEMDVHGQPEANFDLSLWPSNLDERPNSEVPENGVKYLYCLDKLTRKPFYCCRHLAYGTW